MILQASGKRQGERGSAGGLSGGAGRALRIQFSGFINLAHLKWLFILCSVVSEPGVGRKARPKRDARGAWLAESA